MAAVMLLDLHPKLVSAADLAVLERLIRESRTWALVDALAGDVVGTIRAAHPSVGSVLTGGRPIPTSGSDGRPSWPS